MMMDDLTKLPLVGRATAKKLVAAGIDSYGKVATASHADLHAVITSAGSPELQALQKAATKLAPPAPLDLAKAQGGQIDAQAARIDAARQTLASLAAAVIDAYGNIVGMPLDAPESDVDAARAEEKRARELLDAAIADARLLLGVPEGEDLPAALAEELAELRALDASNGDAQEENIEIPAGSHASGEGQSDTAVPAPRSPGEGLDGGETAETTESAPKPDAVASASGTHTTQSDDDQEGGAGNSAGSAAEAFDALDFEVAYDRARIAFDKKVRDLVAAEGAEAAVAFIAEERQTMQLISKQLTAFLQDMASLQRKISRSAICWPLEVIRYDGKDRPIGKPLAIEPDVMARLVAVGVVSDRAPEFEA